MEYASNKIISVGLPLLVLGGIMASVESVHVGWRWLLYITIVLGYTHFLIGGYYQIRAFRRKPQRHRYYIAFTILLGLSLGLVGLAYMQDAMILLAFTTIPYFMLHGFFNEHTLFRMQLGYAVPFSIFGSLALWLTSLTILSSFHPSAYFNQHLEFSTLASFLNVSVLAPSTFHTLAVAAGFVGIMVSIGLAGWSWYRHRLRAAASGVLVVGGAITAWYLWQGTLNYVYFFYLLLVYHFLTWMIFYGVRFYERGSGFWSYVWWHVVIVAACLLVVVTDDSGLTMQWSQWVFNSHVFLFFTFAHITTSFVNEPWFQRWCMRLT